MTTTAPPSRRGLVAVEDLFTTPPPDCECRHDEGRRPCRTRAQVRVTVVCRAEGCDCAAAVYLLCRDCLSVWRRKARRQRVRLRVAPL